MNGGSIDDRLRALLVKHYDLAPETLIDDAALESLGLDSMSVIDLLFNIEDEFHLTVPREPADLKTFRDVVAYVEGLLRTQHGGDGRH